MIAGMLLFFCIVTLLLFSFMGKKGLNWSAGLMLLLYMSLILMSAVFTRDVQAERTFNLTPFWSYRAICEGKDTLVIPIIANVLAFIPIGLLLGCAFRKLKWWRVLLIGGAFSFLIETLQFVLNRGQTEVDDVIHNVIGGVVGYGLYVVISQGVKKLSNNVLFAKI